KKAAVGTMLSSLASGSIRTEKKGRTSFNDAEQFGSFTPPNVFTPNNDGKNDIYKLFGNSQANQNLPSNTCESAFEYIVITNRTGVKVFESESRDFQWSGGDLPGDTYFYLIKFTRNEVRGYIQLIR
ncbi:MAG: gliding motility-associated C-terminal domain-containing protein, partial [Bacteroidota bacterium]